MTIERARELLGTEAVGLSDTEVMELNAQTKDICKALLSVILDNSDIDINRKESNNECRN